MVNIFFIVRDKIFEKKNFTMRIYCKKCKEEIVKLPLTEEQKLDLYVLRQNNSVLSFEKKLIDDFNLNSDEARAIISHLNKRRDCCVVCEAETLNGEFTECPDCGAFNYNLEEPVFNIEFCSHLEWSLDFDRVEHEDIEYYVQSFWCDGIVHVPEDPESLLYKNLEKHKQIITKAWIGYGGENIYEMKIKFGKKSLNHYKNRKSLIDCIPKANEQEKWITLDVNRRRIEVQLK